MKKVFITILVSMLLFSCNNKTQNTVQDIWEDFTFKRTVSNSTQIIIKAYDSRITNKIGLDVESYAAIKTYKATTKKQLEDFDKIFKNAEKTDYCCCPKTSYSILFLNKKEELDYFYVDTIEFKNKVRIWENSYQFSYIVDKKNWKNYLNELQIKK